MASIQCARCNENIELEDGVSGMFSCPNCKIQFEWGNTLNTTTRYPVGTIIFAILSILSMIAFIGLSSDIFMQERPELILTCFGICSIPLAIFVLFAIKGN